MKFYTFIFLFFLSFTTSHILVSANFYTIPNEYIVCQAAENGDVHMLNCLLQNGLTCDLFRGSKDQPLCIVAQNFHRLFNNYCIHCKILQHICSDPRCQKKYYECIQLLCEKKWPVNAQDASHNTALHYLLYATHCKQSQAEAEKLFLTIKELLCNKAWVHIRNNQQQRVLDLAQQIPVQYPYRKEIITRINHAYSLFQATPITFAD